MHMPWNNWATRLQQISVLSCILWLKKKQYIDTDFHFFPESIVAIGQRRHRFLDNFVVHSLYPSWQRHTVVRCCPACRPVDHLSRPCMSPCHLLRTRHTSCCSSTSCNSACNPCQKWSVRRPAVGLFRLPCLCIKPLSYLSSVLSSNISSTPKL